MGVEIPLNLFVNLKQHGYSDAAEQRVSPQIRPVKWDNLSIIEKLRPRCMLRKRKGVPRDYAEALKCWGNFWQD